MSWRARDIEAVFAREFGRAHRTELVGGAAEPLYEPAGAAHPARIHYRLDYLSSALHEVAHWCIAGPGRRQLQDYGYWYAQAGRDAEAQRRFQGVEARPQALEWLFSEALGVPFVASLDNPGEAPTDAGAFDAAIARARCAFKKRGLPPRAERFRCALASLARAAP